MSENYTSLLCNTSWSTECGNVFNNNMSSAIATARGQVLWSVSLPTRYGKQIVVSENGSCFVMTQNQLIAVEPNGHISWTQSSKYWIVSPILLANEQLIIAGNIDSENSCLLMIKDQSTGKTLWSLSVNTLTALALTPHRQFLLSKYQPDRSSCLQAVNLEGELLWSTSLPQSLIYPPLVLEDLIIIESPSYLQAYSYDGLLLWIANQDGFEIANSTNREQLAMKVNHPRDRIKTPIIWLGKDRVLAAMWWYDGFGLYIFDIRQHQVWLWPNPKPDGLRSSRPLAVLSFPDQEPYLAAIGGERKTMLVDLEGNKLWEHQTYANPLNIIADAAGNVFITHSPSTEKWDKYKQFYALEDKCFVKGFNFQGQEIFSWRAPGPLSSSLAIGKAGELYCISEGYLWAIA